MRVVPVIDLKGGTAVHAIRGERERYRPVGDALSLARTFRDALGLDELYVADLDAITGTGGNDAVIGALASEARVMLDAGVSKPEPRIPEAPAAPPARRSMLRREIDSMCVGLSGDTFGVRS